jgi:hypothetical protein
MLFVDMLFFWWRSKFHNVSILLLNAAFQFFDGEHILMNHICTELYVDIVDGRNPAPVDSGLPPY